MIRDKRSVPTTPERSRIISAIRAKNTKPELKVRSYLHKFGLRFRLHIKDLPGRPDLVLPKYNTAIFVHGCFWHGHDCRPRKATRSNTEFWSEKMRRNIERDARKVKQLEKAGWKVITVWECGLSEKALHQLVKAIKA